MGRRSLARLVVGVVVVAAGTMPRVATADDTSGWVTYDPPPPGATVQTLQGTSDGQGGCAFDFSASLAPGQSAARADEVAFNESTCQSQFAFTYDDNAAPEAPLRSDGDSTSSGPVPSPAETATTLGSRASAAAAAATHSAGYMKSWYQDPVTLVVNSVQNATDWNWDGTCVVAPVSGSYSYYWFGPSGWVLQANNWQNVYNCTQSTSSSYVHYHNGVFCALIATDTYYNRNTVNGKFNGTLAGSVSALKAGGCIRLLSFHWSLRRTLN